MSLPRWLAVLAFVLPLGAAAQGYPSKPVKLIVSAVAGAGVDVSARVLAEGLTQRLGQPVIVENKPGASSMLAASQVARSAPDGYTLLYSPNSLLSAPYVLPKAAAGGVDVTHDIVPIIKAAATPIVVYAYPGTGVRTIPDLIALARRSPGITYASGGTGSALHMAGELFQRAAGVKLVHVPYKGLAPATTDVVGGRVQTMFGVAGGVMGQMVESGQLVPLAVAQPHRSPLMPNVPTLAESGVKGADFDAWFMVFAPAGTPADVVARLNRESNAVLQLPEVRKKLSVIGVEPMGGTIDDAARTVHQDYERYRRIVTDFAIKAD